MFLTLIIWDNMNTQIFRNNIKSISLFDLFLFIFVIFAYFSDTQKKRKYFFHNNISTYTVQENKNLT